MRDSAGVAYTSSLLYSWPTQINFEVPAGIAIGAAVFTGIAQSPALQIAAAAPGLFNLNTAGLAAAYAVRVAPRQHADRGRDLHHAEWILRRRPHRDLSPSTDQVYLILYGTGTLGAGNKVTVAISSIDAPVPYSGPQGEFPALDQVNVLLPPQLAGSGAATTALTAAGMVANTVNIAIR